ncbi:MAG: D-alanine--D-alanine ligase family protein [Dissulfurimicrobium sp.]|uniref:D-alanine--D-alanine ligase family protein n=1 Tax=Dissulfurimicrobium TaxID=1769732 RepID=UPI001EDB7879|nr:D-alanine--D-alanine ligase [Dissulfurimicrobium hydrothermale]UKL14157.1 D-alanine--D-alanine ligase [Dissulfurimicrobium hydrothermale]
MPANSDQTICKKDKRLRLALICGGRSAEREVSLKGAEEIKRALNPSRYEVMIYDPAIDISRLVHDAPKLDAAFILLHGRLGEDGTIQGLLDLIGLPYQGSGVLGSALAMDKHLSKVIYRSAGIQTPAWILIEKDEQPTEKEIIKCIGLPLMIKPATQGSSVGMSKVVCPEDLKPAIDEAFRWDKKVIAEAFIHGREITGAVLGLEKPEALPIIEIRPGEGHGFFDYQAKYQEGASREICPAELPNDVAEEARRLAIMTHKALNLSGYSRTDMIVNTDNCIFVLETNTIPGMTRTSLFPQAARAAGISFSELLDRLIAMAISKGKSRSHD